MTHPLTHCKYCGARLTRDVVGLRCPTHNCQWEWGIPTAPDPVTPAAELQQTVYKLTQKLAQAQVELDEARKVIDNDLQWFVKYTEKHPDHSANERYLDCRKWWEAHPEAEKCVK